MTVRFPDFLIVGAMKAGTTTLYRDLLVNPEVYLPAIKEPHNLVHDTVLSAEGKARYAQLFRLAKSNQVCGEASTGYTKLPTNRGVPERAMSLIGPALKIVYIVREPVARIVSHHYHSYSSGIFSPDIDQEIRKQPVLLDYSRYAMQIEPWIETFGRSNVLILVFEEFVASRRPMVRQISEFLGVTPNESLIDDQAIYNRSDGKPTRSPLWRKIRSSYVYRQYVQPYLPTRMRDRMRRAVLPKAPPRPDPPSEQTVALIREELAEDMERLRVLIGRDQPIWTDAAVREQTT